MRAASSPSQPRSARKVVVASLIGTSLEWYDFFLYGPAAALVFNKLFFPDADPLTGTLLAFDLHEERAEERRIVQDPRRLRPT